jgi:hypothetical protein
LAEPAHLEEALAGEALGPLPEPAIVELERVYAAGFAASTGIALAWLATGACAGRAPCRALPWTVRAAVW